MAIGVEDTEANVTALAGDNGRPLLRKVVSGVAAALEEDGSRDEVRNENGRDAEQVNRGVDDRMFLNFKCRWVKYWIGEPIRRADDS